MKILAGIVFFVFGRENSIQAAAAYTDSSISVKNWRAILLLACLKIFGVLRISDSLLRKYASNLQSPSEVSAFSVDLLNQSTNRIFDLPEVKLDSNAPQRINVLVPAFTINSISAGFFGVFNVALELKRQGNRVRLVLFDNFYYSEAEFRKSLSEFPSFSNLFEELEISYIGDRRLPLVVSPNDNSVATVWYSAYFAKKIQGMTGNKPFIYLIQDYESAFYPSSSMSAFADATYQMDYAALVSTRPLFDFLNQRIEGFAGKPKIFFNNACSANLPPVSDFIAAKQSEKTKKFVFYSRPAVNRNMFELATITIIEAFNQGVFGDGSDWEFYGMGLGNLVIPLASGQTITQLPRMTLSEYHEFVPTIDVGLSLMASPHPSIVPFDLAGSGSTVVTNSFPGKTEDYFKGISGNIVTAQPTVESLVQGLKHAVEVSTDLEKRHSNAVHMNYPKEWSETWLTEHKEFFSSVVGGNREK